MAILVMVPIGYLLGSMPFGLIIAWMAKRVDVRDYGSGKTGMTNVLRTVGVKAAALSMALDMGKSILAVILARVLFDDRGAEVAAAVAALIGHNWPVYVGFRCGGGTACGLGGLLLLVLWGVRVGARVACTLVCPCPYKTRTGKLALAHATRRKRLPSRQFDDRIGRRPRRHDLTPNRSHPACRPAK